MKKIGIITIVKVNNYGAELQAFALQQKLSALGYDAELIDYLFYKHPKHKRSSEDKPIEAIGLKKKAKEWVYPRLYALKTRPFRSELKQRIKNYDLFHERFTKFSNSCYPSIKALNKAHLKYDVFVVGSDQVWNPHSNTSPAPYFLDFAPKESIKVSYASSFGVSQLSNTVKEKYKDFLQQFSSISVREKQGVEIVNELGLQAEHVLDPTLLLTKKEWTPFAREVDIQGSYILMYVLTASDYAIAVANEIQKQSGHKIVRICKEATPQDKNPNIINITDAGPSEYLGLFMKASFVITNSFHGTAFAINFNIPFYTIIPKHKHNNSRQQGILELCKLSHRMLNEGDSVANLQASEDFSEVNSILKEEQAKSISFLTEAIAQ